MQPYINSKGFGVVYVFVALAFCQRWPVRLNLIDTNGSGRGGGGRRSQPRISLGSMNTGGLGICYQASLSFPRLAPEKALGKEVQVSLHLLEGGLSTFSGYLSPEGLEDVPRRVQVYFLLSVSDIIPAPKSSHFCKAGCVFPAGGNSLANESTCLFCSPWRWEMGS